MQDEHGVGAMLDKALDVASKITVQRYPVRSSVQRATNQAPGCPSDSGLENTAEVRLESLQEFMH